MKQYISLLLLPPIVVCSFVFSADNDLYQGEPLELLEAAYEMAPKKIHRIADSLNGNAGANAYKFRYAFFDGEPGVGKSTMAKSLAYKTNRDILGISSTQFIQGENRGATTAALNTFFAEVLANPKPAVVIVDEVNQLLTNWDSKHHDADSTSKALWTFLDDLQKQKNIFFVGTMNGVGGLPPQMQSRIQSAVVEVVAPSGSDIPYNSVLKLLKNDNTTISPAANTFFESVKEKFAGMNMRDIEHFVEFIRDEAYAPGAVNVTVSEKHVSDAFDSLEKVREAFKKKTEQESEREERARQHAQNIAIALTQLKLQQEAQERQENSDQIQKLAALAVISQAAGCTIS